MLDSAQILGIDTKDIKIPHKAKWLRAAELFFFHNKPITHAMEGAGFSPKSHNIHKRFWDNPIVIAFRDQVVKKRDRDVLRLERRLLKLENLMESAGQDIHKLYNSYWTGMRLKADLLGYTREGRGSERYPVHEEVNLRLVDGTVCDDSDESTGET